MTRAVRLALRASIVAMGAALLAPAIGCEDVLGIHDLSGPDGSANNSTSQGSGTSSGSNLAAARVLSGTDCDIFTETEWTAGVYVIECNLTVDALLTIDPGAVVQFDSGYSMSVSGTLNARGTAAAPIVFTSLRDRAHGGITGDSAAPAPADWDGITVSGISAAGASTFDYCDFYYAGGTDTPALGVTGGAVTVTNSVFAHNQGPTSSFSAAAALDASGAAAGTSISSNTFYDNRIPLRIGQNLSVDDSNSFDNGGTGASGAQPNQYNGIQFPAGNCSPNIGSNVSWTATKVPFIVGNPTGNDLCVSNGGALTLGPNVILKFFGGGGLTVDATSLLTTGSGDVFTSIEDDANGGDTNGDQSNTSPAPGAWAGVSLQATTGSMIDDCSFLYAGGSDTAALAVAGGAVTVTHSVFAHDQGPTDSFTAAPALDASKAAAGTVVANNSFYDNRIPLRISANFSLDDSNTFDSGSGGGDASASQPNEYNGIQYPSVSCNPGTDITSNINWSATKVPFIIGNPSLSQLCISGGGTLTLGPSVILKFFTGGALTVDATSTLKTASGDFFTSIKDNANGGNTNPHNTAAPAAGDWLGVQFNGVCQTGANILYSTSGC